ncbi:hypothetical protein LTR29_016549 [Friedmanniomyces endolithicus]|uniref:Uncharacterized protein n=1 Tax=Rachicladosporium monterosium TaxID=1507873 RepID=A0ABR0LF01_9PEZI|nr:hypothetical protein LTR29_016549 [Friedmanniomyces endolithicus]KAK1055837.1 hypothetical protein LTR74_015373 [Friedmanniomyces endolithicus]KAK1807464.1 hypothetical protein LTR12_018188 [Friedmanniomyces endolithicus]KAK5147792.1 hypothetical protein LTR32_000811 [Rachicladosporium monterosium]
MRARQRALTPRNIKSGWQATGLEPLIPIVVLDKLDSPPDGTELRKANMILHDELAKINEVILPVKRYMQRMTKAFEATQSELITVRKQLFDSQSLLQIRKARKRGKRVALKDRFEYTTEETLQIAKQADEQAASRKSRKRR